jgi:hypothetical protein
MRGPGKALAFFKAAVMRRRLCCTWKQSTRRKRRSIISVTNLATSASDVKCFCRWCPRGAEGGQDVTLEDIQYYDVLPFDDGTTWRTAWTSPSQPRRAPNYTAAVCGEVAWTSGQLGILRVAARYIKNGTVKFPRHGCEQLITQLTGLGIEKHDDLCDACVWLILGLVRDAIEEPKVHYV